MHDVILARKHLTAVFPQSDLDMEAQALDARETDLFFDADRQLLLANTFQFRQPKAVPAFFVKAEPAKDADELAKKLHEEVQFLTHQLQERQNPHYTKLLAQLHVLSKLQDHVGKSTGDEKLSDKADAKQSESPLMLFALRALVPTLVTLLQSASKFDKPAVLRCLQVM